MSFAFAKGEIFMNYGIESEKVSKGLEEYVDEFIEDRTLELKSLRIFLEEGDLEAIREITHRWKGFCAPYGFNFLEKMSLEIEQYISTSEKDQLEESFKKIESYLLSLIHI